MGIFTRKKEQVVRKCEVEEVDGAEIWMVSWDARFGEYRSDVKRTAKAFFSEKDANDFKDSLYKAKALLQNTENLHITVERQS